MNINEQKKIVDIINENKDMWQLNVSIDQIRKLTENADDEIKALGEWYIKYHKDQCELAGKIQKYKQKHPNLSMEEIIPKFMKMSDLTMKESLEHYTAAIKIGTFINFLGKNKEALTNNPIKQILDDIENDEFPVVRIVADQINNISKMLEKFTDPIETANKGIYKIYSDVNITQGTLELEYEYPATNEEDAKKIRSDLLKNILGEVLRACLACWAMVPKLGLMYKCSFTKIMNEAFPGTKKFNAPKKAAFFAALSHGSRLKFIYTTQRTAKNKSEKKFHIPLIQILETEKTFSRPDLKEKYKNNNNNHYYPTNIKLSVLPNPQYDEKLYNIYVGVNKNIFNLPIEDFQIACFLRFKKHQLMNQKYLPTTREELIKKGNLEKIQHKGMANKKLIEKLKRINDITGIITETPKKITDSMKLKIR